MPDLILMDLNHPLPFYERAISKMNIDPGKLKLGMIEDVDYPENHFDFITFGAVLEHLYHPAASIEKAMKWLKPGGHHSRGSTFVKMADSQTY